MIADPASIDKALKHDLGVKTESGRDKQYVRGSWCNNHVEDDVGKQLSEVENVFWYPNESLISDSEEAVCCIRDDLVCLHSWEEVLEGEHNLSLFSYTNH